MKMWGGRVRGIQVGRSFESYSGPPIFGGNGRGGSISPHFGGFFIIG